MRTQHTVNWGASLDNGETIYEGKGDYIAIEGELSPWQKLRKRMEDTGVRITSLSLYAADGRRWNLPSAGRNPKFRAFDAAPKPVGYRFFRKMGGDVLPSGDVVDEDRYTCIEAQYEDGRAVQLWVDEKTMNAWTLLV